MEIKEEEKESEEEEDEVEDRKSKQEEREREREQMVTWNKQNFITCLSQSDSFDTIANLCAREEGCKNLSSCTVLSHSIYTG